MVAIRPLKVITALVAAGTLFGADELADLEQQIRRITDVYSVVEELAADPIDPPAVFYRGAIPGMLATLDPHSVFLDPDQFLQLQELQDSTEKGFGSVVSVMPGRVIVLQTVPGTPSARSGLEPGDEILAINGIQLSRLSVDQLGSLLTEARRHEVRLDTRKPGGGSIVQLVMTPAEVAAPSVDLAFLLRPSVGYVRIRSFEAETADQLREAIDGLGGEEMEELIIDLRGNPGGVLDAGIECAALFLPQGAKLVSLRGRNGSAEDIVVPEGAEPYGFRLGVLIDERTASAAEIVTGALQDHARATIVGQRSYGKGLVQSVFPLSEGTAIALTTALYFTPNGRFIQRPIEGSQIGGDNLSGGGIEPDVRSEPRPLSQLAMALEATGAFTTFATQLLRTGGPIDDSYDVSPAVLDRFRDFLYERNIQPGVSQWSADAEWIRSRLRQEVFNQSLGVAKGDEVEIRRDPEVRAALTALERN